MSVYFVTCREANAVKIGHSVGPRDRVKEIQWGCPLTVELEAVLPGGREEEALLHLRFADHRIRGEWFRLTAEIEAVIAANAIDADIRLSRRELSVRAMWERLGRNCLATQADKYAAAIAETQELRRRQRVLDLDQPVKRSQAA